MSQPTRAVSVSPAMVRQRAADLIRSGEQILVLRARPEWPHGDISVEGEDVKVVPGVSQLGILDTYTTLEPGQRLVVLTDRPREDLGDAVLARAYKQTIDLPDEWSTIPRLFPGAREVSRELRALDWAATALLDHQPSEGWPRSPELAVTAQHAVGSLLAHVIGQPATTSLDPILVLTLLGQRTARNAWTEVDPSLRSKLIRWAHDAIGPAAAIALQVAQRQEHISPLAVGLALDVLWSDEGSPSEAQVAARVRMENYVDGKTIAVADAKTTAQAAHSAVLRLESAHTSELPVAIKQAEALLMDVGWGEGAERSLILRAGYDSRLRDLAEALSSDAQVEEALARLKQHRDSGGPSVPDMAVRLSRWLHTPEAETGSLADDVQRQVDDGAWVDAALGAVWSGSDDPEVSAAYGQLIMKVRERRHERDRRAAGRLHEVNASGQGKTVAGVERLLADIVAPWRAHEPVLLVVMDGMSSAISTTLSAEVSGLGLLEWVPRATHRRTAAVAALPSLTNVSRTSLFCGEVRAGDSDDERRGLSKRFPKAELFHKGGLRADGGAALPDAAWEAIHDSSVKVVGVVINAIDDATHKNDTSGSEWTMGQLEPLRALLDAAVATGRTVVITSDHGHVVERGTEKLTSPGAESRWRPTSSGDVADGEVLVSGPRVAAAGGEAVLLWREDARFGPTHAGYHGGASLAELTVPVLVFRGATAGPGLEAWEPAVPQTPAWWNDPVNVGEEPQAPPKIKGKKAHAKPALDDALFQIAMDEPKDVVDSVMASVTYSDQREMAGRGALADDDVRTVLRTLVDRKGRSHVDTVAAALGVPATEMGPVLAGVRRLLNVDGYPVVEKDPDGVTLRVDLALLREQFEVG